MSIRSYADVMEYVRHLEADADGVEMRAMARMRYDLLELRLDEGLPEYITRGDSMPMRLASLKGLAERLLADVTSYGTSSVCTPYSPSDQSLADRVEKAVAIQRGRWNRGSQHDRDAYWHAFCSPYYLPLLQCGEASKSDPWTLLLPEPMTQYFPISGAPSRPAVAARHYRMLVRDVTSRFHDRRQSRAPVMTDADGRWGFEAISDDYRADFARIGAASVKNAYEEVEVYELDDGENIYTIVMNRDMQSGELVYVAKNMTGGVRGVVISGASTPQRLAKDRLMPALWEGMQIVYSINRLETILANRILAQKPDAFIESDSSPEEIARANGSSFDASQLRLEGGQPNIINVGGKVTLWESMPIPELMHELDAKRAEYNIYLSSWSETSDPQVYKDANVGSIQPYLESRRRRQTPVIGGSDYKWNEYGKMMLHSITEYDQPFTFVAIGNERVAKGKSLEAGGAVTIAPADVDFEKYNIETVTKSMTEQEQRLRLQDQAYKKTLGAATQLSVIMAAGDYEDEQDALLALATDSMYEMATPVLQQQVARDLEAELRLELGIIVVLADQPPADQPENANLRAGGSPVTRTAGISGPTGGST